MLCKCWNSTKKITVTNAALQNVRGFDSFRYKLGVFDYFGNSFPRCVYWHILDISDGFLLRREIRISKFLPWLGMLGDKLCVIRLHNLLDDWVLIVIYNFLKIRVVCLNWLLRNIVDKLINNASKTTNVRYSTVWV